MVGQPPAVNAGWAIAAVECRRHKTPARLRAFELQNVQTGVGIGEIHHAILVDETVGRLNHLRPVRPRIVHFSGGRRHEIAGLGRSERIFDVVNADTGIVQRRENEARTLERSRPILPEIMRTEIAAFLA